jgi:hypothetical protein
MIEGFDQGTSRLPAVLDISKRNFLHSFETSNSSKVFITFIC